MNDFRYWLFDDYDNRGSEMLIGKFATMEEVRAAAKAWESETDGRCSLLHRNENKWYNKHEVNGWIRRYLY